MREQAKEIAALMAQLSNQNRLLILCALQNGPLTVGEIAKEVSGITGPALSQHLHRLREGGLIASEKRGQYVRYAIRDNRLLRLMQVLKEEYCTEESHLF